MDELFDMVPTQMYRKRRKCKKICPRSVKRGLFERECKRWKFKDKLKSVLLFKENSNKCA